LYKVGDVLKWAAYPLPDDENSKIKTRWFIYLGEMKDGTHCAIMCTPTTQLQYYEPGQSRSNRPTFSIKTGQFGFKCECIIDFKMNPISKGLTPDILVRCQKDIQVITNIRTIDENFLRMIYNKILKSGGAPIVVRDIHTSFNLAGITGLNKPKMRN
jgi:hypothetical protein